MYIQKRKKRAFEDSLVFGRGDRVRVSGGHLCATHRSTDRGGSRDFEPAALSLLRCPKSLFRLGAPSDFDRCAILASLHRPPGALRRRCPKQICFARKKREPLKTLSFLVEATGFEPAALCSQSRCATKLRYASVLCTALSRFYVKHKLYVYSASVCSILYFMLSVLFKETALSALLRCPKLLMCLGAARNFDRCAISPSLYPPPAAVGLNAQSRAKPSYASVLRTALARLHVKLFLYIFTASVHR